MSRAALKIGPRMWKRIEKLCLGTLATAVWISAARWALEHQTDGFVPRAAVRQIAPDVRHADRILDRCAAGGDDALLDREPDGWRLRSLAEVGQARRAVGSKTEAQISEVRREAGRRGAAARWAHKQAQTSTPAGEAPAQVTPPASVPPPAAMANDGGLPSEAMRFAIEGQKPLQIAAAEVGTVAALEITTTTTTTTREAPPESRAEQDGQGGRILAELHRVRLFRGVASVAERAARWESKGTEGVEPSRMLPIVRSAVDTLDAKLLDAPDMRLGQAIRYLDRVVADRARTPEAPPSSGAVPTSARPPSQRRLRPETSTSVADLMADTEEAMRRSNEQIAAFEAREREREAERRKPRKCTSEPVRVNTLAEEMARVLARSKAAG